MELAQLETLLMDMNYINYQLSDANPPEVQELLVKLAEECAETIVECSKALRFGVLSSHPKRPSEANMERITREVRDIIETHKILRTTIDNP